MRPTRRRFCGSIAAGAGLASMPHRAAAATAADGPAAIGTPYFGMHFHRLVRRPGEPAPTVWPEQPAIGALRLWDAETRWGDIAPQPGRWNFDRLDVYVARAAAHGAAVLLTLGSTPRWASARPDEPGPYGPGCGAEPRDMADWVDYLRRVLTRYRGAIHAYELWNEPNFSDVPRDRGQQAFYTGSVAAMVAMAREARRAIDAIDPQALLATPGFVNGPDRLALFLAAGGTSAVDIVAYHFYSNGVPRFASQLAEVREVMRRAGVASLPLWNTECGVETVAAADARAAGEAAAVGEGDAAVRMAQFLLLGAAGGIERFFYYAWDNGRTGMVDVQEQPRPRLAAYAQVQAWLLGARLGAPEATGDGVVRVPGARGNERFVLAWAEREAPRRLRLPRGWRVAAVEHLFEAPVGIAVDAAAAADTVTFALTLAPRPTRLRLVRAA